MSVFLMDHNVTTYDMLVNCLESEESAAVVQATGTGKSYIALKYIEEHCSGDIIVVVPTNALAKQWREKSDLPEDRTTVYTYSTLNNRTDKKLKEIADSCDLLILDEMHRAGAEQWGITVKKMMGYLLERGIKTIGLTATPIRSLDNNKDMVEDLFGGRQISGIDLKDAITEGVLPSFEYVTALYRINKQIKSMNKKVVNSTKLSKKEIVKYDRVLNSLRLDDESSKNIKKIIKKHLDLKACQKIILFAKDIQEKEILKESVKVWFPTGKIYDLDSTMSQKACSDSLDLFNKETKGISIITSVDKLNEGVHLNGVTSLIMLRRTQSNIIFFQQLGRALDASNKDKNIVVFDFVNNYREVRSSNKKIDFIGYINDRRRAEGKTIIINDYTQDIFEILDEISRRLSLNFKWTKEEDAILIKYYPIEHLDVCKRLKDRDEAACTRRALLLGIHEYIIEPWTKEEDAILIKYYPTEKANVYKRLVNRSKNSCTGRAKTLGVYVGNVSKIWTEEEDEIIIKYYPSEGAHVQKRLPERSEAACCSRAHSLKVYRAYRDQIDYSWSNEELKTLKEWYPKIGGSVFKMFDDKKKNKRVCIKKAKDLKIEYIDRWSNEELKILKKWYSAEGSSVYKRLKNRSRSACYSKAVDLGLTKITKTKLKAIDENGNLLYFDNPRKAGEYVVENQLCDTTRVSGAMNYISTCARSNKKGYGLTWSYLDD